MSDVTIYHNPRCGKSRETLRLLRERGVEPTIVEYLKTPPDEKTLDRVLTMLGMEPMDLIRTKERVFKELGDDVKKKSRQELIRLMVAHPVLMERPIVVKGNRARLGRPPENVLGIL